MNLQVKLAFEGDLAGFGNNVRKALAGAIGAGTERIATQAKLKLREDTRAGGLGDRVANAWQQKEYANAGRDPAALVWSKVPSIMQAFAADTIIVPKLGLALAIPTDNVPHQGHRRMTPVEVEAHFDQDLILRQGRKPGITYGFVNVARATSGKGFRKLTKRRAGAGRKAELILMFVFVKQVHLEKRLNWPQIFVDMKAEWQTVLGEEVEKALAD